LHNPCSKYTSGMGALMLVFFSFICFLIPTMSLWYYYYLHFKWSKPSKIWEDISYWKITGNKCVYTRYMGVSLSEWLKKRNVNLLPIQEWIWNF
jgi:hypothetical protein